MSIESDAMKSMLDAGLDSDQAAEMLHHAQVAGMTSAGAPVIEVRRKGPWSWEVSGGAPVVVLDDPLDVLLDVARRLHGDSHPVAAVQIDYARNSVPLGDQDPSS
jgi:hypothetical protein